ncbi:MAG: hypothetical protein ACOVNW_00895 [Flavobacterium sp.]|jgi:hypothetical protein
MKKFIYLFMAVASLGVVSCEKDNDVLTGNKNEGGLLDVKNNLVAYVVGNGNDFQYSASLGAFQGDVTVQSVDIYKQFTGVDGSTSNRVFLKNIAFPNAAQLETVNFNFTYTELSEGILVNGQPLPTNDAELEIGDSWTLTYVSKTSSGNEALNNKTTKVSVGTRFAGNYRCVEAEYYRLGVLTYTAADWPASTTIESVNSTTYRVVEYFGVFSGNEYYFTIDENDVIGYPDNTPDGTPQSGNGQPFITCLSNPADMTPVHCGTSNYVIRDDVEGKDRLVMSFGYNTTSGAVGPRVFYQVLEKIVE